jgi:PAS domain S-box-containing protein
MPILEEETITVKKERQSFLPRLRALSNQLSELESDLSLFWQMSPSLLLLVKNNKIAKTNPAWQKYLGYKEEDLKDKKIIDLVHEDDRQKVFLTVNRLKNTFEPQVIIVRVKQHKKDHWIYTKISLSYEPDSNTIFCTGWPLLNKCMDCPYSN